MIEISILELLYLVLTFFLVIVGTLLTLVLLRLFKILSVGVELVDYYNSIKSMIANYALIPGVMKDKIFEYMSGEQEEFSEEEKKPTEK